MLSVDGANPVDIFALAMVERNAAGLSVWHNHDIATRMASLPLKQSEIFRSLGCYSMHFIQFGIGE